jgi:hypothetical protein
MTDIPTLWRAGLPRVGPRSGPNKVHLVFLKERGVWF